MENERTFLIIGMGTFGSAATRVLYNSGATVIAIDVNEEAIQRISDLATRAICVDALDEQALRACGALDVNVAIVAVRRRFDTSVLVTHLLKQAGIPEIAVLVDSEAESGAIRAIGATSVIFPERDMAHRIANKLLFPDLADQIPLGQGVAIIEVPCPPAFEGKSLIELNLRREYSVNVIALSSTDRRHHRVVHPAPHPTEPLKNSDHLILLGKSEQLAMFKDLIAKLPPPEKDSDTKKAADKESQSGEKTKNE